MGRNSRERVVAVVFAPLPLLLQILRIVPRIMTFAVVFNSTVFYIVTRKYSLLHTMTGEFHEEVISIFLSDWKERPFFCSLSFWKEISMLSSNYRKRPSFLGGNCFDPKSVSASILLFNKISGCVGRCYENLPDTSLPYKFRILILLSVPWCGCSVNCQLLLLLPDTPPT